MLSLLIGLLQGMAAYAQYTEEPLPDTTTQSGWSKPGKNIDKEKMQYGFEYGSNFLYVTSNPVDLSLMIGYRITKGISAGLNINYMLYAKPGFTKLEHGYGGGVYARAFLGDMLFIHTQANLMSLIQYDNFQRVRTGLPVLLAGGGIKRGGFSYDGSTYSYFSILFQLNYREATSPYFIPVLLKGGLMF